MLARLLLVWMFVLPLAAGAQSLAPWRGGATPPLELQALDGSRHALVDYRGRVVVLNFWATWCVPCRAEMPSMERLRRSLDGQPFAVLAVNVGEDENAVRAFADSVTMRFALLLDIDTRVTRAWGVRALPTTFIIGPDGRILYTAIGARDWSDGEIRARLRALMLGARPLESARGPG